MDKEIGLYIHNKILYSIKKKETLPFATTWMDLEDIMPSEINQTKTNTTLICAMKVVKVTNFQL